MKVSSSSLYGLVLFFLGTTPVIHNFWTMEGKERHNNKINFLKNVALLGGVSHCSVKWTARSRPAARWL